jgi:uncharacterized membrane protein YfcA
MDLLHIPVLLAAGAVAGFLAGFFGVGGGIILVPILLWFFTSSLGISALVATHLTFGTSLLIVIFASLASGLQYRKNGHVVWKAVVVIGLASVAGALAGSWIAASLKGRTLQQIFAAVVGIAAVRLLLESPRKPGDTEMRLAPAGLAGIGLVTGAVSSLAGVGGGVFSIPMMYYFMKFPLKKALGTSSATIVITATAAMVGYVVNGWGEVLMQPYRGFTIGYVDYLHALPVILATLPMAQLGAATAHRTHVDRLRTLYAVFLLIISVKMFFF